MSEHYEDYIAGITDEELIQHLRTLLGDPVPYGEMVGAPYPYNTMGPYVYPDREDYFIDEAANRLERNIPTEVKVSGWRLYCPVCGKQQKRGKCGVWYCERCGQALKEVTVLTDALSKLIKEFRNDGPQSTVRRYVCNVLLSMLGDENQTPTIEAEPVRHGRWERSGPLLECQSCGEIYSQLGGNAGKSWNYCPNCGAKMNKEEQR